LAARWAALDMTVHEGLIDLAQYCTIEAHLPDGTVVRELPAPRATTVALLAAAQVELPTVLPPKAAVDTTRKLPARRTDVPPNVAAIGCGSH